MGIAILAIYCSYWVIALKPNFIYLLTFDRLIYHDTCQKRVMEVSTQLYKSVSRGTIPLMLGDHVGPD